MRRFFIDALGNYLVFAPIVITMTPALRTNWTADLGYLVAAVPISLLGSRLLMAFYKHIWYPLWGEEF